LPTTDIIYTIIFFSEEDGVNPPKFIKEKGSLDNGYFNNFDNGSLNKYEKSL
jgi:hypothetical protein